MKHKELVTRKLSELNNIIARQESSISRLESPEALKEQLQVLRSKIVEIEILVNNEESSFR
jgi:hypothetical protein